MLEANSAEQIQGLLQMRLDVALVHSIQPPEGIASQLIVEEPFVACLPEGHPLCACEAIDLSALQGDRLILFSNLVSPTYHQRIYEMCLAHGFAPEVRHEVRHWLSVISMVSLGQGVALVPAALERVGLPRLAFRPLRGTHPSSEMLAMWRRAPANPLVQALLAHLRAAAGAMAAAA
jgi:DNA-binding transcriptional LysR family regulator